MPSTALCSVVFLACALTLSAAQRSCKGQCGGEYYRGYDCQCDYTCLSYGECCKDFESQCTTANSCQGRCGEPFKRGRLCNCDPDCVKYNQCCSDYETHCSEEEEINGAESVSAPCNNVKDNKPKDPDLYEATEDPFIEGNNEDYDIFPEASPSPQDDLSDDISSQPTTDPADPKDQVTTEATLPTDAPELSTETVTDSPETSPSDIEPTQADADSPTESADVSDPEMPTTSPNSGTTLPPSSTSAEQVPSQPASTSVPETEPEPTDNTPELPEIDGQPASTSVPETEPEPTDNTPELPEIDGQPASTSVPETEPEPTENTPETDEQLASTSVPETEPEPTDNTPEVPETDDQPATTSVPETEPEPTDNTPEVLETDDQPATTSVPETEPEPTDNTPEVPETDDQPATTSEPETEPEPTDNTPEVLTTDPAAATTTTSSPTVTSESTEVTKDSSTASKDSQDTTTPEATTKPQVKPDPYKPQPTKPTLAKPQTKPVDTQNTDNPGDYQGDDSNDTNLCSGRPVGAVTTLKNGTVVVFRGHYFWFLDRNKVPGPARGITQVWGVPSPIDTSFTRCNCQGKTYIFKGPRYWRFENDVLDPGYPQAIQTGFDGLRGQVTAALSVPQHRTRREAVYFFKRGGTVQKYSYQFGTSPTCGKKIQYTVHTIRNRLARQAVSLLGPTINIRKSWKGFPHTITAAVSVPTTREPEGYKYVVFSRAKSYNIRINDERPVVAPRKVNVPPQSNEIFKCPKKV